MMSLPPWSTKTSASSASTHSVLFNLPLLLSVVGVVISAVTNALVVTYASDSAILSLLRYPTLILFVLIFCFALFEIAQQGWIAVQNRATARSVSISALFGGFLLGPLALTLAANDRASLRIASVAIVLSILSFIALFIVILQKAPEPQPQDVSNNPEPEIFQPPYFDRGVSPPAPPRAPRPPRPSLAPLFESDPLYTLPQPKRARFFSAVKGNDNPIASEDACAISSDEMRFALCDGASGSSLSRPWATLLAQQWIKEPLYSVDTATLLQWLYAPRQHWLSWVQDVWWPNVNQRNSLTGEKPLSPSVVNRMLKQGAAATFLGISLSPQTRTLNFTALGDTCFFVFRQDKVTSAWQCMLSRPLDTTASFSDRPPLLSSKLEDNATTPYFQQGEEIFKNGDILLMATDALAQWVLGQLEQGQTEWHMLLSLRDQRSFADFVDEQRYNNQIQDDDTTLLVVQL